MLITLMKKRSKEKDTLYSTIDGLYLSIPYKYKKTDLEKRAKQLSKEMGYRVIRYTLYHPDVLQKIYEEETADIPYEDKILTKVF